MKINKKTKFILFSLLFLVFLIGAGFVLAKDLEVDYPLFEKAPELTEKSTLTDYIGYVFNFVIWASGFIILGVLIYSGILYLVSAGDPGRQSEAKKRIIGGFVGIIIIFGSYLLLTTINPGLVMVHLTIEGIKITEPGKEPEIEEPKPEILTLFQVPAGKIVERIVLDDAAAEFLGTNEEIQELMSAEQALNRSLSDENFKADLERQEEKYSDSVLGQVNKTKELSELLLILSNELKIVTDACDCGWSKCQTPTPPCKGKSCAVKCNWTRIEVLKNLVNDVAQLLLEQAKPIRENQMVLVEKIMEIKKPAFLMSLMSQQAEGIIDYKTMLTQRHFLEEQGKKVEFETSDDWKDPGQDTESTADDTLLMDVRTGFAERQELPPTFDPATFYFEKNNKTNVFIAKAGLIEPSLMVPDLEELFKKASEQVLKQWLEELLKQLKIENIDKLAKEILKEDLPDQQAVEKLIKKLPESLNQELLDRIKKESLDKLDTTFIDKAGSLEEQIKRIYEGVSKNRLNINLPKDMAEGFTDFLSAVFSGSRPDCSLENSIRDSLKMSFRDNGINSLDDLIKRLTKYSGNYDLLKIELENKQIFTLNDLINKTTQELISVLGNNINFEELNASASENLSSILSQSFGINLSLGGMTNLPKTFGNKLLSSLIDPYIDSLNDLVKEALNNSFSLEGLTNNGLIKDLFQDTGIYTIEDLAERIGLTPIVLKDILDDFNILEFDDLVTGVSKELSIDLTGILKGGSLEKAGIETLEKLNERLSGEINSILIYDFQIGDLPTELKTNISNNLLSLLQSFDVGSLESLIDKSLGGFLDKSTRDGLKQVLESLGGVLGDVDVNDFDGLNSVLITNFNERIKTNFGIENLDGFVEIIAGGKGGLDGYGLSDYLLIGLGDGSLKDLGLGGINDILIGKTSTPGINKILEGLGIELPDYSVLIPDYGFGPLLNIESISMDSWKDIGIDSIDNFFKDVDFGNILSSELDIVLPAGINFGSDFINRLVKSPLNAITGVLQEQLSTQIADLLGFKFPDFSFIPSSVLGDNPFLQDLTSMTSDLLGLGSFFGF